MLGWLMLFPVELGEPGHLCHLMLNWIVKSALPPTPLLLLHQQQQRHLWNTVESSQPAAWTANRNLLVASHAKAFPGAATNSGSNLSIAVHLEGGVIGCCQCITSHSDCSPASLDMQPVCIPSTTSIPGPTQPAIAMTNYTLAQMCINLPPSKKRFFVLETQACHT